MGEAVLVFRKKIVSLQLQGPMEVDIFYDRIVFLTL